MFGQYRITQVYRNAYRIPVEQCAPIVIMSDCHRGVGNWNDNFARNQNIYEAALKYYYEKCFTYIELGDGDELWENKNFQEIKNQYKEIFHILEKFCCNNRMYIVYGNHDAVKAKKGMGKEFEKCPVYEGVILRKNSNGIFLLHGHQGELLNDYLSIVSKFLVRHVWKRFEYLGINDPTSAAKNNRVKKKTETRLMKWSKDHNHIIIAGHTHRPILPQPGEHKYFNSGCCVHPYGITAIEILKNSVSLVKWSYGTTEKGIVYVRRKILVGPEKLEGYF